MNDKFFDLKKEKQDRMINASLKVFAMNGYQHASTDDIVKEAGISKGLLFHYFGSKLGLYTFLTDYCVRYMILEISTGVSAREKDYFALHKEIETAKLQALKNYPYMQQFLNSMEKEDVNEALVATEEQRANLAEVYEEIWGRADTSRFRSVAEAAKIEKIIHFTITGLMSEEIRSGAFQPELFHTEIQHYLTMLNNLIYK